uniref:Uncharacterized protein n=1 Tax=Strongyloides papillosus TaxID=174720 RepID=A0A0N5B4Z9_STREA
MEYDTTSTRSVISVKVTQNFGFTLTSSSTYISDVTDKFINYSGKTKIFAKTIGSIEINKEFKIQVAEINYNILSIPGEKLCVKKFKNIDDEQEHKLAQEYFMANASITFIKFFL